METKMMYVIDTSVVVKWFVKEKDSDVALEILEHYRSGNFTIIVPDLLIYEFTNVLRYKNEEKTGTG
jgi:predicted nucleic acid-binding protein